MSSYLFSTEWYGNTLVFDGNVLLQWDEEE